MAATTGIINATDINIYVDATKIAHCTSAELSMTMAMMDASSKDSAGYVENLPGLRSWEMSGEAFYSQDSASVELVELFDAYDDRTALTVDFTLNNAGDKHYSGSGYISSLSSSAGVEENATISFTFTGTGVITEATVGA